MRGWERMFPDSSWFHLNMQNGKIRSNRCRRRLAPIFSSNHNGLGRSPVRVGNLDAGSFVVATEQINSGWYEFFLGREIEPQLVELLVAWLKEILEAHVKHFFVQDASSRCQPLCVLPVVPFFGPIELFNTQRVSMTKATLEDVCYCDESYFKLLIELNGEC